MSDPHKGTTAPAAAPVRLTYVEFLGTIRVHTPKAAGRSPGGVDVIDKADAAGGSRGQFGYTIHMHFDPLGRREYVSVVHAERGRAVEVPYAYVKSTEEHWGEEPYVGVLAAEAAAAAAKANGGSKQQPAAAAR